MLTTSHLDRQVFVYLAMPFAVCPSGSLLYGRIFQGQITFFKDYDLLNK